MRVRRAQARLCGRDARAPRGASPYKPATVEGIGGIRFSLWVRSLQNTILPQILQRLRKRIQRLVNRVLVVGG